MGLSLMKDSVLVLIGGVIGILASYCCWWYITKRLVPNISFANKISKIKDEKSNSHYDYYIKFQNIGNRNIVDITICAIVKVRGNDKTHPQLCDFIQIPVGRYNHIPVLEFKSKECNGLIQCRIYINNMDRFSRFIFDDEINKAYLEGKLNLDDILGLRESAELKFYVMGSDGYSGTRICTISKPYHLKDIEEGYYSPENLNITKFHNG